MRVKPAATIAIGAVGGLVVGMTSVGSGSLMIVLLLFAYPALAAGQLVGTDLTQAVPLTAAAALGALLFGHVQFGLTTAVVIGSVPAVLVGSLLSSRAPDKYIRPVITFVIFAPGSSTRAWDDGPRLDALPGPARVRRRTGWRGTSPGAAASRADDLPTAEWPRRPRPIGAGTTDRASGGAGGGG